jgi:beta-galactosidase
MINKIKLKTLSAVIMLVCINGAIPAQVQYPHVFSPLGNIVSEYERPYRDAVCLNGTWQFMPVYETDMSKFNMPQSFVWDAIPVKIPSPWNVNSFAKGDGGDFVSFPSYPEEWNRASMGWMRKEFDLPAEWKGRRITLGFDAIAGFAEIYVNGQLAGKNLDIFFATRYDVTDLLKDGRNEIIVGVAKASLTDVPGLYGRRNYVAGSFWGQHIAGIWQDVWMTAAPALAVSDVFVQPDVENDFLNLAVTVRNQGLKTQTFTLSASIRKWSRTGVDEALPDGILQDESIRMDNSDNITLKAGDSIVVNIGKKVSGALDYWTPNSPNLYGAIVSLSDKRRTVDAKYVRFGWRQFSIRNQELLLNGDPIVLKGDSWHFMGIPQMTRRYAQTWFNMLKDANANAVRLHAQPYPSFYLDMADEMGICVLPETGIWSSDGGPKMDSDDYWVYCRQHVRNMVLRDRNHPAVFGWSVCNETLPVVINVMRAPEWIEKRQVDEINRWVAIVRELDPTRAWISGDGEDMRPTDLPVVIGHYGDESSMRKWSSEGKPWGVGETGMAYYGTPRQVSSENGARAYESQQGRMEGLAAEAYRLIGKQLEYNATYASVFNIVWYGLKPLAFGLRDTTLAPLPSDGVFFPPFREGVPGVQPERIGAYSSTLNPGYDPSLPAYMPWPLFDAIKAINANLPMVRFPAEESPVPLPVDRHDIAEAAILSSDDSRLREELEEIGVSFTKTPAAPLLIIDGKSPPILPKKTFDTCLKNGGTILVSGISPEGMNRLNELLPYAMDLTERKATSFVKKADDPVLYSLSNKDYYFTELTRNPVMQYGLSGDIVRHGTVLLEACNTDWSRWNSRPEYLKTAAVYRSERESKPEGIALLRLPAGNGTVYLMAMDLMSLKAEGEALMRTMLSNLGLALKDISLNTRKAFASGGDLERAAYISERAGDNLPSLDNAQFASAYETNIPEVTQTDMQGYINLSRLPGIRREDSTVYLSFWIFSPRSLVNLLVEPDMPQLNMIIEGQAIVSAYINASPATMNGKKIENMPLDKGWNHIILKFVREQQSANWRTRIQLDTNDKAFLRQLKSSVTQPN